MFSNRLKYHDINKKLEQSQMLPDLSVGYFNQYHHRNTGSEWYTA